MTGQVLVVGAGPTGLALALWLAGQGVRVRVIDRMAEPGTTSRALAVQARTLEFYSQWGLAEEIVRRGHKTPGVNLWTRGKKAARVPLSDIGEGLTPYPFMLIFPQDEHERLLIERLAALGVIVERRTELLGFDDDGEGVTARLRRPGGEEETIRAAYIAGCDGAHSVVREILAVEFPGGVYRQRFYVADVDAEGPPVDGELHIDLDEADFLAVFPMSGAGRVRVIGTVSDERADSVDTLTFDDVSGRAIANLKLIVRRVNWFSTYRVHHRVAARFRSGRAFLLGDAAHIHSPAGGQGMNTGIGDAINLAWKLAAVIALKAPDGLLDSYEAERIGFARRLVATTDRAFSVATGEGPVAAILRTRIVPVLAPLVLGVGAAREFLFRTVSQITLNYRGGPLAKGVAGRVQGGDRLPWVVVGRRDNFASLASATWQIHVYGVATPELSEWCGADGPPLHLFAWRPEYAQAGLERDALYLLRPDSYVGFASRSQSPAAVRTYLAERGIVIGRAGPDG